MTFECELRRVLFRSSFRSEEPPFPSIGEEDMETTEDVRGFETSLGLDEIWEERVDEAL